MTLPVLNDQGSTTIKNIKLPGDYPTFPPANRNQAVVAAVEGAVVAAVVAAVPPAAGSPVAAGAAGVLAGVVQSSAWLGASNLCQ